MSRDEIVQVFLNNINDNFVLNLAICLADEWESQKKKINSAIERLTLDGDIPAEKYEWVLATTINETKNILQGEDTKESEVK